MSVVLTVIIMVGVLPMSIISEAGGTNFKVGDIIELGTYPQSLVTDTQLIITPAIKCPQIIQSSL